VGLRAGVEVELVFVVGEGETVRVGVKLELVVGEGKTVLVGGRVARGVGVDGLSGL